MAERVRLKERSGGNYFAGPKDIPFISTGCKVLDLALGGGWAEGRIANIVGDKSTGKTLLCIEAAANFAIKHPKGIIRYAEGEAAFDEAYAGALGMPLDRVEFNKDPLDTVEHFFDDVTRVAARTLKADQPGLYILDSLDALSDDAEMKRNIEDGSFGASKAKKLSELFRRKVREIEKANLTVLIVSQIRDKIGVTFGETKSRTGGHALDFYASQVLWLAHMKTLSLTRSKRKRAVGVLVKAKCKKNKVGLPFREALFEITFGYGIEDELASIEWLKENNFDAPADGVDLAKYVEEKWYEVEKSFLPTRRKYGG